jgi:hypothetical protein
MRVEATKPCSVSTERNPLASRVAEQVAASADRLEQQAAQVRAMDKQFAMRLMKEATRLRQVARGLDIQHKQAERARMRRKNMRDPDAAPDQSRAEQAAVLRRNVDDDLGRNLGEAREWW